ncbi:MAG TPA: hypothetical protein VMY37_02045 [Thermoguttaceae bacterium]|nr:hypothetical protein [Thermoguttaceae bacterium]
MFRWLLRNDTELFDGVTFIILGAGLLAGKIVGVVMAPINLMVGILTVAGGIGLVAGTLISAQRYARIKSASWVLVSIALAVFIIVNLL